jgi:hypothetical protein
MNSANFLLMIDNPKYDVALSFLASDVGVASALNEKLSQSLQVFFFPNKQEELAGTEGLETLRKPFLDDSRVVVVLYREGWGTTPWTRVEETAIKDGCLAHGWKRLIFIVLDKTNPRPPWLPDTHIWLSYADYGLEEAVGAIKARVQQQGGEILPMTPRKQAQILKAEEEFRLDRAKMNSEDGIKGVLCCVEILFTEIRRHCEDIKRDARGIDYGHEQMGHQGQMCVISTGKVSTSLVWYK